eukprot:3007397-Pleurochrysis_carterae.AAC.1
MGVALGFGCWRGGNGRRVNSINEVSRRATSGVSRLRPVGIASGVTTSLVKTASAHRQVHALCSTAHEATPRMRRLRASHSLTPGTLCVRELAWHARTHAHARSLTRARTLARIRCGVMESEAAHVLALAHAHARSSARIRKGRMLHPASAVVATVAHAKVVDSP